MEPLAQLENNIHRLFERIDVLEQEVDTLRKKNNDQLQEIMRTHSEFVTLQDQYHKLQVAYSMLGGEEERNNARSQVSNMIAQLDRALEALKQ